MAVKTSKWRQERLNHLRRVISQDIASSRYFGCVIKVTQGDDVLIDEPFGAESDRERPLTIDSVFNIFSVTKALTNVLCFKAIELGQFALTTKISEVIPEFSGGLREHITVFDLLTHSSGLPQLFTPRSGMFLDRLDEVIKAIADNVHAATVAQERVDYAPLVHHALLGEMLRRTDPQCRSYRQIAEDELFKPLGMKDTAVGLRADLRERKVVPDFRGNAPTEHRTSTNPEAINGAFECETAEMPWVGCVSTTDDLWRFAEMLRKGGQLDGVRIVSSAMVELATRNWTGDKPNEMYKALAHRRGWRPWPAYMGLGFALQGPTVHHSLYGTLASQDTFGNYGAGSSLFWVDPRREITFAYLSAGVMNGGDNFERFQRICDIAISAAD